MLLLASPNYRVESSKWSVCDSAPRCPPRGERGHVRTTQFEQTKKVIMHVRKRKAARRENARWGAQGLYYSLFLRKTVRTTVKKLILSKEQWNHETLLLWRAYDVIGARPEGSQHLLTAVQLCGVVMEGWATTSATLAPKARGSSKAAAVQFSIVNIDMLLHF